MTRYRWLMIGSFAVALFASGYIIGSNTGGNALPAQSASSGNIRALCPVWLPRVPDWLVAYSRASYEPGTPRSLMVQTLFVNSHSKATVEQVQYLDIPEESGFYFALSRNEQARFQQAVSLVIHKPLDKNKLAAYIKMGRTSLLLIGDKQGVSSLAKYYHQNYLQVLQANASRTPTSDRQLEDLLRYWDYVELRTPSVNDLQQK